MARSARVVVPGVPHHTTSPNGETVDSGLSEQDINILRAHERTGRPLTDDEFLATLEKDLGRILRRQKPGPKPSR
jgi:hypothetical protein